MWRPMKWGLTSEQQRKAEQARFDKNLEEHLLEGKRIKWIHETKPSRYKNLPLKVDEVGEKIPSYFKEKQKKTWNKSLRREELRKEQRIIVKYALEHPLKSWESIGNDLGVDPQRVGSLLNRYQKIKMLRKEKDEQDLVWMYEDVLNDIAEITAKNIKKYKDSDEKLRTSELKDLSTIAKETQERKNLIEGKPTENQNININFN